MSLNASVGIVPPKSVNSAIQIAITQYGTHQATEVARELPIRVAQELVTCSCVLGRMKPFRESREKVVGEKHLPTGMMGADS